MKKTIYGCILLLFLLTHTISPQGEQQEQSVAGNQEEERQEQSQESGEQQEGVLSEEGEEASAAQIDERLLPIGDDEAAAPASDEAPTRAVGFSDVIRMLFVLAIVVALIYLTFALLRKASRAGTQDSPLIRTIASATLGGSRGLHIIEIGTRYYIIGSAEHSVRLIEVIADDEVIAHINEYKDSDAGVSKKSFKARIGTLLSSFQRPSTTRPSNKSAATIIDAISEQHHRLRNM